MVHWSFGLVPNGSNICIYIYIYTYIYIYRKVLDTQGNIFGTEPTQILCISFITGCSHCTHQKTLTERMRCSACVYLKLNIYIYINTHNHYMRVRGFSVIKALLLLGAAQKYRSLGTSISQLVEVPHLLTGYSLAAAMTTKNGILAGAGSDIVHIDCSGSASHFIHFHVKPCNNLAKRDSKRVYLSYKLINLLVSGEIFMFPLGGGLPGCRPCRSPGLHHGVSQSNLHKPVRIHI